MPLVDVLDFRLGFSSGSARHNIHDVRDRVGLFPREDLADLVEFCGGVKHVFRCVAERDDCPEDVLRSLSRCDDTDALFAVADNPGCPEDVLVELAYRSDLGSLVMFALSSRRFPVVDTEELFGKVGVAIVAYQHCDREFLGRACDVLLAGDPVEYDWDVFEYLLKNDNADESVFFQVFDKFDSLGQPLRSSCYRSVADVIKDSSRVTSRVLSHVQSKLEGYFLVNYLGSHVLVDVPLVVPDARFKRLVRAFPKVDMHAIYDVVANNDKLDFDELSVIVGAL